MGFSYPLFFSSNPVANRNCFSLIRSPDLPRIQAAAPRSSKAGGHHHAIVQKRVTDAPADSSKCTFRQWPLSWVTRHKWTEAKSPVSGPALQDFFRGVIAG